MNKYSHLATCGIGMVIGFLVAQLVKTAPPELPEDEPVSALTENGRHTPPSIPRSKLAEAPAEKIDPRMLNDAVFVGIEAGEIEALLRKHEYSRESLIGAALVTNNLEHLREAAQRYPDDPHVQLLVITKNLFPEERSAWIDRFKASQPENSLASILKGGDLLASGNSEEAISELRLAAGQTSFNSYDDEGMLAMESNLLGLGRSALQAKMGSTFGLRLEYLEPVRDAIKGIAPLAETAATPEEKTKLVTLAIALGNQMSQGAGNQHIINQLVGLATERKFLSLLDPELESEHFSATPAAMLEQVEVERNRFKESMLPVERLHELTEQQFVHYLDRLRVQGEVEANLWVRRQLGE